MTGQRTAKSKTRQDPAYGSTELVEVRQAGNRMRMSRTRRFNCQSPIDNCKLKGFTLVELLVVVAVISLLASILLPTLRKARESARSVACLSNERSIGLAICAYAKDYNQWLPPCYQFGTNWIWYSWLNPYLPVQNEAYHCPAHDEPINPGWLSYGYNEKFGLIESNWTPAYTIYLQRRYNRFVAPERTSMLVDLLHGSPTPCSPLGPFMMYDGIGLELRHGDTNAINVLWVDGHAGNVSDMEVGGWTSIEWGSWGSYPH